MPCAPVPVHLHTTSEADALHCRQVLQLLLVALQILADGSRGRRATRFHMELLCELSRRLPADCLDPAIMLEDALADAVPEEVKAAQTNIEVATSNWVVCANANVWTCKCSGSRGRSAMQAYISLVTRGLEATLSYIRSIVPRRLQQSPK